MDDSVPRFAAVADEYRGWVRAGTDTGPEAVRRALGLILRVYLAALELPGNSDYTGSVTQLPPTVRFDAYTALAGRLPFLFYGEVFDPRPVPPEPPVVGDLADDLADVYYELDHGLRHYDTGDRDEAVWKWRFGLVHHWGEHATSAIRAMHCWLAGEQLLAPDS